MDPLLLLGLLFLNGKKSADAAVPTSEKPRNSREFSKVPPPAKLEKKIASAEKLAARAATPRAQDWKTALIQQDASPLLADALARWIGIESSGNPLALSPIGERGLLQATRTTALKEKAYTADQWAALQSPNTTREEHARLALVLYRWILKRAYRLISNPPPASDETSWAWYGKLYHARPMDLRDAKVHGAALPMSRDLAQRWAKDPHKMKRLRAANLVAFGSAATA